MATQAEGAERTWRAALNDNLLRPVQAFGQLGMLMIVVVASRSWR